MNHHLRVLLRTSADLAGTGATLARWPVRSLTSHRMVRNMLRQGIAPRYVVDVGANRGQFATAILELIPSSQVLALEPLPEGASRLRDLSERYGRRLKVVEAAAGASRGRALITVNAHSQSSSFCQLTDAHLAAFPEARPLEQVEVAVLRLDELLDSTTIRPGSLLKIDAQGFERNVLEGAGELLGAFGHVLVEASFRPLYRGEWTFTDLLSFASDTGLEFLRPVGLLKDRRTGEFLQMDALFRGRKAV